MSGDQASLPELVRDSKFEDTTFHGDLTIHTQPLGRRRRLEKWRRGDILGHGGYGVVMLQYKVDEDDAVDASSQRTRAVKMVRTRGQGPGYYVRELEALAKFSQAKVCAFILMRVCLCLPTNPPICLLHISPISHRTKKPD